MGKGSDWNKDRKQWLTETQTKLGRGRARGGKRRGVYGEPRVKEWNLGVSK